MFVRFWIITVIITNNNNKYQFGFRKNHSTSLALVDVLDTINNYLDKHEKVIALYLDLQKAFDTVDHDILLYKMYNYGICGELLKWFRSYLSDRRQYVCVGNACSDFRPIKCGVPQGWVLGPLLFLMVPVHFTAASILYSIRWFYL